MKNLSAKTLFFLFLLTYCSSNGNPSRNAKAFGINNLSAKDNEASAINAWKSIYPECKTLSKRI